MFTVAADLKYMKHSKNFLMDCCIVQKGGFSVNYLHFCFVTIKQCGMATEVAITIQSVPCMTQCTDALLCAGRMEDNREGGSVGEMLLHFKKGQRRMYPVIGYPLRYLLGCLLSICNVKKLHKQIISHINHFHK